ncbi:hypothetical protein [Mycobacterium tilburgii]|uniref:hypothetical protein n=1 Tax=Mycobacterium tilburgii TaxID=44467 RepID=UPI003898E31A
MDRERIAADHDALRAAVSRIRAHSYDALTLPERFGLLQTLEHETRRVQAPGHQLIT